MCLSTKFKPKEEFTYEIVNIDGHNVQMIAVWKILIVECIHLNNKFTIAHNLKLTSPSYHYVWNIGEFNFNVNKNPISEEYQLPELPDTITYGFHTYFHEKDADQALILWKKADPYGYIKYLKPVKIKMYVNVNDIIGIGYSVYGYERRTDYPPWDENALISYHKAFLVGSVVHDIDTFEQAQNLYTMLPTLVAEKVYLEEKNVDHACNALWNNSY